MAKTSKETIEPSEPTEPVVDESKAQEDANVTSNQTVKPNGDLIDIMQFIGNFSGIRMEGNYLEVAFKSYCRNNKINDKVSMDTWVKRFEHFKSSPPSKPLPENLRPKAKEKVGGK